MINAHSNNCDSATGSDARCFMLITEIKISKPLGGGRKRVHHDKRSFGYFICQRLVRRENVIVGHLNVTVAVALVISCDS